MQVRKSTILMLLALLLMSVAPTFAQDDASECEDGFRLIEHSEGATCVTENPERIIPISAAAIEFFATIGYSPGFRSTLFEQFLISGFPYMEDMFNEAFEGSSDPGLGFPPNLEVILELEADVLISAWGPERYPDVDTLSEIVPTVFTTEGFTWQDELLFAGDLINEREAAEELIAGYDERVAILQAQFDDPSEISITVVRVAPENLQIRTPIAFTSQVLADVGFAYPEAQLEVIEESPDELLGSLAIVVSEERLDLMDADYVFLYPPLPGPESEAVVTDLLNNPIFQTLSASQEGNAHAVRSAWTLSGIHAAHAILDDLFIHVAGVDPAEVSPNPFLLMAMDDEVEAEATEEASANTCEDGFRAVTHELDTTCVPVDPQRVVVLHPVVDIDNLLALEVVPVGVGIYTNRYPIAPYLAANDLLTVSGEAVDPDEVATLVTGDDLPEALSVGMWNEPNLEVILELEPDLIIARTQHEAIYDQLTAIAPTVVYPFTQQSFESHLMNLADAVNRTEAAEELLEDFDARIDELGESLGDDASEIEVSIVRIRPEELRLYVANSQAGAFLDRIGLGRPEAQQTEGEDNRAFLAVSLEEIDQADGDVIFVWAGIDGTNAQYDELTENPLWQTLSGVQAEQVYLIDEAIWFAPGIIGANLMLDDVQSFIVENEALRSGE